MGIRKELLDILACPRCKGPLRANPGEDGLICDKCRLLYEIKDDIPIMLIEKAKALPVFDCSTRDPGAATLPAAD
jgi:uncharacterized protein YbaR (Trm112 family)